MAKNIVIFLHGVGSRGSHLKPILDYWKSKMPEVIFAAPNAPFPFAGGGDGFEWFSLNAISEQNRPQRVLEAREHFDNTLNQVLAEHGASFEHDHVLLVGFSQGSIMTLDALASGRLNVAGAVAFSGRFASVEPYTPRTGTPLLLVHGKSDGVISWHESENSAQAFKQLGLKVDTLYEEGLEHTVSQQGADRAAAFIANVFSS